MIGPVTLRDWAAFCAYCRHPIEQGELAFLDDEEDLDTYVHAACVTAYVQEKD
jgi:hypothetical protein